MPLYFAYGSNLKTERLTSRVGEVGVHGIARWAGHRLSFAKRGKDGSGKACCVSMLGEEVFGVVYALTELQLTRLDDYERGYSRNVVQLKRSDGSTLDALTYHAEHLIDDLKPFSWYKLLMIEGAREHVLPAEWIARLEAIEAQKDPRDA